MNVLEVIGVCKSFPGHSGDVSVLDELSFQVGEGEFVSLFGPNGTGKSTLIEMIAGLDMCTAGEIRLSAEGRSTDVVTSSIVFQDYRRSLMPWASVRDNILFPLELAGVGKQQQLDVLDQLVVEIGSDLNLSARIHTLSGGQAQLVCIMRALTINPKLLICDEPFSALDFKTRMDLQTRLMILSKSRGFAVLFVSHDLDEAILLGDRVIFLSTRPARNVAELKNPMRRPRVQEDVSQPEFSELRKAGLKIFRDITRGANRI